MEIRGARALVLGGSGLVGQAVCRALIAREPAALVVTAIDEASARATVPALRQAFPDTRTSLTVEWGNVFVPAALKDRPWHEILGDPAARRLLLADTYDELTGDRKREILEGSTLFTIIRRCRPDLIVDAINTATAIAYQDIYESARELRASLSGDLEEARTAAEQHLVRGYVAQLVRHVQILHEAMKADPHNGYRGARVYVKVGTSGTGGMGLNIPYTHGEERPSRVLLSKAAVAGAQTLLLFLAARTPDGPVVKEVKPTAAIAWKEIGFGPIRRRGRPIELFDCPPDRAVTVAEGARGRAGEFGVALDGVLESVYIDTGENGLFSTAEFAALTALGQMESVTPEEIAAAVLAEIRGANTGLDVIAGLDATVMGPSYRAGALRGAALARMQALEAAHGVSSIAFEILGPPRLSKLLYEAHLLRSVVGSVARVLDASPEDLSAALEAEVGRDQRLRSGIVSIGLGVLLPDGDRMLRGPHLAASRADDGWVDLTPAHMARWQDWLRRMRDEALRERGTGSGPDRRFVDPASWQPLEAFAIGEIAAWIFVNEDRGRRLKA